MRRLKILAIGALMAGCSGDKDAEQTPMFDLIKGEESGINFRNDLGFDEEFNIYTYRNFYNGGGVAIGDVNNDGLVDVYLSSNKNENKLYINLGGWKFEDVSKKAGVTGTKAWSTGVNMVDINGDGWLDIYVCNSGDVRGDNKQNELFINNGDLTFTESAKSYGLDDEGFSTHASFFDYDRDGDLDVYILNNSYKAIGGFNLQNNLRNKRDSLGGDKLLENIDGHFHNVSEAAGIYGSEIGFGLGVTVGDVNNDGWQDIYVSNDFFERDYLYINNGNKTFSEQLEKQMKAISGASMGADMADINNDGYVDIFVTDMLPRSRERLKTVSTFEDWNKYQFNIESDYYHQFTRNTFQVNNGNNTFSEIGRLAGVEASDWSWGALIFDINNDGSKDIFIANGIYQDLTNQDYLRYISNEEVVKSIITNNSVNYKKLIELIPSNPIQNYAFLNKGNLQFDDSTEMLGLSQKSFSNGSAYGDLDNDGDLDLVVNNVNSEAFIYQNKINDTGKTNFIKINLHGEGKNSFAIGAKISVSQGEHTYHLEQQPARGFQSSVDPRPNFGLKTNESVLITIQWPSGKTTRLLNTPVNQVLEAFEKDADSKSTEISTSDDKPVFTATSDVFFQHVENEFVDFHRERLLYHMMSTEGPRISGGDVNNDGAIDFYISGSKGNAGTLVTSVGSSWELSSGDFIKEKESEDMASVFFDADNDGDLDLYVCSGGNEFNQSSSALVDRLYVNDGRGNFARHPQLLPISSRYVSTSTVSASDYDADGDTDLFVGERSVPFQYGLAGSGFLLNNDGKGNFTEVSEKMAPALRNIGMITASEWGDVDNDGDDDLVLAGEYMAVTVFKNDNGKLVPQSTSTDINKLKGWWNELKIEDVDGDGDRDIIVGNHGRNSRFKASSKNPIKLFIGDFDQNGSLDPILTTSEAGKDYPFALRHNLSEQIKPLNKKFPDYSSYKNATINEVLIAKQVEESIILEVNELTTGIFVNNGNFEFSFLPLPVEAQLAPTYAISTGDYDHDGDIDILMGGNLYGVQPEVGRYDASFGTYLENKGGLNFVASRKGFFVDGEVRDILTLKDRVIVLRNSDSAVIFSF